MTARYTSRTVKTFSEACFVGLTQEEIFKQETEIFRGECEQGSTVTVLVSCHIDGDDGVIFDRSAYPSLSIDGSLDNIENYVVEMIEKVK